MKRQAESTVRATRLVGDGTSGARLQGDEGLTAVWFAVMLVGLLLFAALGIDGGRAYQTGRQSQNSADSGAMAGQQVLDSLLYDETPRYTVDQLPSEILKLSQSAGADTSNGLPNGSIQCWVVTFPDANNNTTRLSPGTETDGLDICSRKAAGATFTTSDLNTWNAANNAGGVEVRTRVTRTNLFAQVAGYRQTPATRPAKAFSYGNYGPVASPFIVCGVRGTDPNTGTNHQSDAWDNNNYSFDMIDPTTTGVGQVAHLWTGPHTGLPAGVYEPSGTDNKDARNFILSELTDPARYNMTAANAAPWVNAHKYYSIVVSQVPTCGSTSSNFKGFNDNYQYTNIVPNDVGITNGTSWQVGPSVAVAGMTTCNTMDNTQTFAGCALLIPIAEYNIGNGGTQYISTTYPAQVVTCPVGQSCGQWSHVVKWIVWYIYGNGSPNFFSSGNFPASARYDDLGHDLLSNSGPVGSSCNNAYSAGGGSPKYCARPLGVWNSASGDRGGKPKKGESRILGLGA